MRDDRTNVFRQVLLAGFWLAFLVPTSPSLAQTATGVDKYDADTLLQHGRDISRGKSLATEILARYPNHFLMLTVRNATGQSELHENNADVIIVLEGEGQLITGGTMLGAKQTEPGEQRGSGIAGGSVTSLKKGDIVHVPAKIPHQVVIAPKAHIQYLVVKADQRAS